MRDVPQGQFIGIGIHFGIVGITLPPAVLLARKVWRDRPAMLTNKEAISIEDVLVLVAMVVDCLQITALGPDLSTLSHFFDSICAGISVKVDKLMVLVRGMYWVIVDVTLGVVGLLVLICVLKYKQWDKKLCCSFAYWTQLLMPTLCHLLFLPIIAVLTSVFICYKGISDNLTDTFHNKDCFEFCWRGKHLGYAIGSAVALLLYIPVAMCTRHIWQDLQSNVHVKAVPLALVVKSVVQIFLIASSNALREAYPSAHAYIYFSTITFLALLMLFLRQYNYHRLNLWQVLLTISLLSFSAAAHISSFYPAEVSLFFLIALAGECALLGVFGLGLQIFAKRFEAKLVREKRRDLRGLFRFAFTGGKRAAEGLQEFYANNHIVRRTSAISEADITLQIRNRK